MTLALDPVARRLGYVSDEDWQAAHNHDEPTHADGCPGCEARKYEQRAYAMEEGAWEVIIGLLTGRPCDFGEMTETICWRCGAWGEHIERGFYRCPHGHLVWRASADDVSKDVT